MFRLVPPAGTPISVGDLAKIFWARLNPRKAENYFSHALKEMAQVKHCLFINSGQAGLYLILETLKKSADRSRQEVIIPAYTCFTIPAAIAKAGLKIRLADIDPQTLDYDYNELAKQDLSGVLAILSVDLFGIVSDWGKLKSITTGKDVFLIDDAAQTMGLPCGNGRSGGMGDVGFYSFGRGKNITTYSGGAILTNNNDLAVKLESVIMALRLPGFIDELNLWAKLKLYTLLLHPRLYWLPNILPFLKLGETVYNEKFEISGLSKIQKSAGAVMISRLNSLNEVRIRNANLMATELKKSGKYRIPGYDHDSRIPYLRLPVLAQDRDNRDRAINKLRAIGIVSSAMYPSTICRIPNIKHHLAARRTDFPGGERIADRLFTLPTHPYLTNRDIEMIILTLLESEL